MSERDMDFARAREIVRLVLRGHPYDEDVPTGEILLAICVLLEKIDRG